jgi:hypothetical protein
VYVDASGQGGLTINVYFFPSSSDQAVTPDTSAWFVSAKQQASGNYSFGTGSVAYGTVSSTSGTITADSGSLPVEVPCTSTNPSTGTTCSAGDEVAGFVFTPPRTGLVEICANFTHTIRGGLGRGNVVLAETSNTDNTYANIYQKNVDQSFGSTSSLADQYTQIKTCGIFNFGSVNKKTIRLFRSQDVDSTLTQSDIHADASYNRGIQWTAKPITQSLPAPILTNMVSTSASSGVRVESASIGGASSTTPCTSTPCTVYGYSTSWISGVSRGSIGSYTWSFTSGTFSAPPICIASANGASGTTVEVTTPTTTSNVYTQGWRVEGSLGAIDAVIKIICMGPR